MKKFLLYFFGFIFICFLLPAILTKTNVPVSSEEIKIEESKEHSEEKNEEENSEKQISEENKSKEKEYDYKKYKTINLLHKKTGEVETVGIDQYLCNVVSAEMPVDYELEALKAQALVARTYTIYKAISKKHENADICDDSTCCQAWISKEDRLARWEESKRDSNWTKIEQCVNETAGKIVTYNNQLGWKQFPLFASSRNVRGRRIFTI